MKCKTLSEITQPMIQVTVQDYVSKKIYFNDSEVIGWLVVQENQKIELYHIYRRGFDEEANEEINELNILPDEPLAKIMSKTNAADEFLAMLDEAKAQFFTGENIELYDSVKAFINKNYQNQ